MWRVVYFIIVAPYKHIQAKRGQVVFGDAPPVKTCPACLSSDLPAAAAKCRYCGTDQPRRRRLTQPYTSVKTPSRRP